MAVEWKSLLLGLVAAGGLGYGAAVTWLYVRQERLLFQPDLLPADHRYSALGADVQELSIPVPGAKLSALYMKLRAPKGLVFYLHGNAGSLESWFVNADFYRKAGYDLFMIDYRGYGKSSGRIQSEAQLRADVRAAWDFVAPQYTQAGLRKVIYGRSLGTGLATGLAAEVQPDLTLLVSPYTSMKNVVGTHFPYVPGRLLRYPLDSTRDLRRIEGQVLLIHGQRDTLIPPSHAEALLPLARHGRMVLIPKAAHGDLQDFDSYREAIREALAGQ